MNTNDINFVPEKELAERLARFKALMRDAGVDFALIADNATIYYLTWRVFSGFVGIYADDSKPALYFVRRPVGLTGDNVHYIRKPEDIPTLLPDSSFATFGIELDIQPYSTCVRLSKLFEGKQVVNVSGVVRCARAVKSALEIEKLRESGKKHTAVYSRIPSIYRAGMTDIDFQIELERLSRVFGCLGQFRISGGSMELFMANILVGDNADNPTPYDFAMGGAGQDSSLPVGANGTLIESGKSVMVDCNGNFTGYMTDMTRVFALTELTETARKAHDCSRAICRQIEKIAVPGTEAKALYFEAVKMAEDAGLADYFMGHAQKAGFIGHGIGIEINEAPVLAPKSRDVLAIGNVIAVEPKFVIPGVGAVGIENSYVMTETGFECLTNANEEICFLVRN